MLPLEIEEIRALIDRELGRYLPPAGREPRTIHEAMRYSVFAGGKRLRPALVLLACRACGGDDKDALPAACAAEMIHTYSLVHDDLPAMDDDDMRRGKPSCHKKFGEAAAILAGDALLTLAFEVTAPLPEIALEFAAGAGTDGMIGGQIADLEAEGIGALPAGQLEEVIERIHTRKTAALIRAGVRAGGIAAKAQDDEMTALTRYGECLGLAFQITDDILDMTGSEEAMGKAVRKDIQRGKLVHPAVFGLEESRRRARGLVSEAEESLSIFGDRGKILRALAKFVIDRTS